MVLLMSVISFSELSAQDEKDTAKFETQTIEVDALKGIERFTPATFENIERAEIEEKYTMQDLPMLLKGYTSINAYSESGSGVGYSYLTIRGFDQRRISILINGIPQNDPEDHQVYWVDISDLTASVEDIQIQRGIGTSLYGASSIGGVVNLKTIDFFRRKFFNVSGGLGDFNSKRFSLEFSSGNVENEYGFYGKFTNINTDGYRDLSWSDHWSYFLSAGKTFGKNAVLKFNTYGSPIRNHLAYLGVERSYLDGQITGDKLADRKVNYLTYPDETDNYYQPHYELVFNYQPSKRLFISNTLSYIVGDGYFNTYFPVSYGYDFSYFNLDPFYVNDTTSFSSSYYKRNEDGTLYYEKGNGYVIERSDVVSRLTVNNNTFGWFPQVTLRHSKDKGNFVAGGELRLHRSEHYGEVKFANALPPGTEPDHLYYFYNGYKTTASLYAYEIYQLTDKLNIMLGLQYVYHRYEVANDRFKPYDFDVIYNFFNPRAGNNYNFDKTFSAYLNIAYAQREPRLKDIYDGENPYSRPNFRIINTDEGIYEEPLVNQEKMTDYEAGVEMKADGLNAEINLYYMDFRDEIVNNGALDNVGQPISGNAGKSAHTGIELNFGYRPFEKRVWNRFSIEGNLNVSDNYFKEYTEILGADSAGNVIYGNDYSGNKILLTPGTIGNLSLNYNDNDGVYAYVSVQYVGKQFLDNSEDERKNPVAKNSPGYIAKLIDPYTTVNAGLGVDFAKIFPQRYPKKIELSLKANNIFDQLYETAGSISYGIPYWIPAATRNFYAELIIGF
jgi:iron complex outermembrane receptor protein